MRYLCSLKKGTNNLHTNTAPDIAIGIYEIKRQLEAKLPTARILLLAVLPRTGTLAPKVAEINKIISGFEDKKRVFFLDMTSHFQKSLGQEVPELYLNDTVHPNTKGYEMWHQVMEPSLKIVLGQH